MAIIAGSGIMGEKLAQGNVAVALLANSVATGAGLFVLIRCIGGISGAHFNPVVTLVECFWGRYSVTNLLFYWVAQILGAVSGVLLAHTMFDLPLVQVSANNREGLHLAISEFVATFGLISVIALSGKKHLECAPMTIAAYITAAYWFTSSTSFANPAVTLARSLTNTFCGIAPSGLVGFILAQFAGAIAAYFLLRNLSD